MTRKDYELIADAVRYADITPEARNLVARALATNLRSTNPRFDMLRFVDACKREES